MYWSSPFKVLGRTSSARSRRLEVRQLSVRLSVSALSLSKGHAEVLSKFTRAVVGFRENLSLLILTMQLDLCAIACHFPLEVCLSKLDSSNIVDCALI